MIVWDLEQLTTRTEEWDLDKKERKTYNKEARI